MRTRVPNIDLLVDLDCLVEVLQRLLIDRPRRIRVLDLACQAAVIRTDADVEEGKVRLDGNGFFVFRDRQVILPERFEHIGIDPVDIHPLRGLRKPQRLVDNDFSLVPLLPIDQDLCKVRQSQRILVIQLLGDQCFALRLN